MEIRVEDNKVFIDGYVNAVERKSKPLKSRYGTVFVERICKGAFKRALEANQDVRILANHDWQRDLGGTGTGEIKLAEDNIGLRVEAVLSDSEVVEKARSGELSGWSFGFSEIDAQETLENGVTTRDVKDLFLYEISLLYGKMPAYDGTLVSVRSNGREMFYSLPQNCEERIVDYSKAEKILDEINNLMKGGK